MVSNTFFVRQAMRAAMIPATKRALYGDKSTDPLCTKISGKIMAAKTAGGTNFSQRCRVGGISLCLNKMIKDSRIP